MKSIYSLLIVAFWLASTHAQHRLVVHEWGTFTSLQDEEGLAIGGLNTDDEPVPDFVHTIGGSLLQWPTQLPPSFFVKGFPRLHPDVTLRLETPVMYFYPSPGQDGPLEMDVHARFQGGWLTEFYPWAQAEAWGLRRQLDEERTILGGLDEHTVGVLTWAGLRVGVDAEGPWTEEKVWLAPRQVQAASVAMPNGESEKYLFYRGVGHVPALLRVQRRGDVLALVPEPSAPLPTGWAIGQAWLAHIRADGRSAFRPIGRLQTNGQADQVLARVPASFVESAFDPDNLRQLRASMRQALIEEGLFADEAEAMLETWEVAYFQSPGLRLFYTVPPAWTDHYLPLEFSQPVDLVRVMVGRIEVVTPQQRAWLGQIAATPVELFPGQAVRNVLALEGGENWTRSPIYQQVFKGQMAVADLGVALPESFLAYLALGRLRNALILDELERRPTAYLQQFIDAYRLTGYQVPEATSIRRTSAPDDPPGWRLTGAQGAQVLGPLPDGPVYTSQTATAVQVQPEDAFQYWEVALQPPAEQMNADWGGVRLAFHPGDVQVPAGPSLALRVDDEVVELTGARSFPPVDLARRQWQVLEVPFQSFRVESRAELSIRLEGNLSGTFYLDDVGLLAPGPSRTTAVLEARDETLPMDFALDGNFPNPFNSETVIGYRLPQAAEVDLTVYNLSGQPVAHLVQGLRAGGTYTVRWAGRDLATGVYLYRLQAGAYEKTRQLTLLR